MLTEILKQIFARDLGKLKTEISSYRNSTVIWHIEKDIKNSGGNLCLHLVGNLNTYIGAELGKTGYIRHRDLEFSSRDIPRDTLIQKVEETTAVVQSTLDMLRPQDLEKEYPLTVFETTTTTGYMLVHLAAHLSYHLGQVNYHRRLLDVS